MKSVTFGLLGILLVSSFNVRAYELPIASKTNCVEEAHEAAIKEDGLFFISKRRFNLIINEDQVTYLFSASSVTNPKEIKVAAVKLSSLDCQVLNVSLVLINQ